MLDVNEINKQAEIIIDVLKTDRRIIINKIDDWLNLYFDDSIPKSIYYGAMNIKQNADEESLIELDELVMDFIYLQTFLKRCGLTPFYEGHNYRMAYKAVEHM